MNSGGFTETIWHFAGYLRIFQDEAREREIYAGDPAQSIPDEDSDGYHQGVRPAVFEETVSQPVIFRPQPLSDASRALQHPTLAPPSQPAKIMPAPPLLAKRLDPQSSDLDYGYGYRVAHGEKLISVTYQDGGTETLLSLHQVNHASDRDLLTSDAIRYPDGTIVVPPELHLDGIMDAMLLQAEQAVPAGVPEIRNGGTSDIVEAFESRDARWVETGTPNPDGTPVSHSPDGRFVDGSLSSSDPAVPSTVQIAPWRPAVNAPADHVEKQITAVEPTGGVAVIAETGLNTQINAAIILDANEAPGSMIVGGDSFFSRGIVQVNVLVDSDHVDVAISGALKPAIQTQGNAVHNIAEFTTHLIASEPNGAAATPAWSVDIMPGSFYDVKSIVQFNGLDDSDRIVQAESGTYFEVKSGENSQINLAKISGLDSYDVIIIGGNYHRADWIYQYNIVLDSDIAKVFTTGDTDDSTSLTAGFNRLSNIASITTHDSVAFKPMLNAHHNLLDALDDRFTILTPNADWDLNGNRSGTLHVLYVPGDYYDVNVITQVNMLTDADQVIQASAHAGTTQGVATGGNIALNEAHIIDPGTLSASKYLGGDAYEESMLIQVNMITDSDTITIHDTRTLVPELIAFAQNADSHPGSDSQESRPVIPDPAQHDHLTSNIMC